MLISKFGRSIAKAALAAMVATFASNADADEFYSGKQVRIIVGAGPGTGYDLFARVLANHWNKHISGAPAMIVSHMPGAGSLVAANFLANVAPRDGTVIGALNPGIVDQAVLFPDQAKYDARRFGWIGSILRETQVAVVWHTAAVTKFDDVFQREMILAVSGGGTEIYPKLMNGLLGTRFKLVPGYKSSFDAFLAMERREADGQGAVTLAAIRGGQTANFRDGKLIIFAQLGLEKHPELPNVPLVLDYAKTPAERTALLLMLARQEFGRPFATPQDVPTPRVSLLRRAFDATMKDAAFIAEIKQRDLDMAPITGEAIDDMVAQIIGAPKDVVDSVRAILSK